MTLHYIFGMVVERTRSYSKVKVMGQSSHSHVQVGKSTAGNIFGYACTLVTLWGEKRHGRLEAYLNLKL